MQVSTRYPQSEFSRYLVAIVVTLVAMALRMALNQVLGELAPFAPVFAAVIFSSLFCGLGPSIASAVLGLAGTNFFILGPGATSELLSGPRLVSNLVFLLLSALIIALAEANRRTATKLEETAGDTNLIQNVADLGSWTWTPSTDELLWSPQKYAILSIEPSDRNFRQTWQSRVDPQDRESVLQRRQQATGGGCIETEYRYHHPTKGLRWILNRASSAKNSLGQVHVTGVCLDITERKQAEQALREAHSELELRVAERTAELEKREGSLRELSGRLLQLQDNERRHIARELHDSVGQLLVALSMDLSALKPSIKDSPNALAKIDGCEDLIAEMSREIRTISHLLHPPLLDESGLSSALRWYVEGFAERSKIQIDLSVPEELGRLPQEMETAIFRVVQESLTNIHRHSGSGRAMVQLSWNDGHVAVEIRDEGKGISADKQKIMAQEGTAGVGIRGMRERIRQLGGAVEILSDDSGTAVRVSLPVAEEDRRPLDEVASL